MSTLTTPTSAYPWRPDTTFFAANEVVGDALILQTSTIAGEVDGDQPAVRVAYVDDAESADYVDENAEIPEDEPTLSEAVVRTKKLARLVNLSSEQFRQEMTAEQVSQSVARDLVRKADNSYIADVTDPTGLLNIPGTVSADAGVYDNLDNLVELIATLESNGATPSAIAVDPYAWSSLQTMKIGTDYNAMLLGAGTETTEPRLLSLPILRSRFIPAYHGLVLDRRAIVSAIGPVQVAVSEHALFSRDAVQLRATWRIGWGVTRPNWLGKFSLEPGS
ncbi:phage major capsid protein [Mycobacterium sp. Y57]|uniref:phage major capsid protein n=1 Tax=Mycolicibacterium xanthum TaxID=2796469 RepID=UPI001C84A722|nr:phage major capsid protein [Mycolicibacterium xanthum]MBX7434566.1 phage major capsid protein [Mycolicibacterium xanthum]